MVAASAVPKPTNASQRVAGPAVAPTGIAFFLLRKQVTGLRGARFYLRPRCRASGPQCVRKLGHTMHFLRVACGASASPCLAAHATSGGCEICLSSSSIPLYLCHAFGDTITLLSSEVWALTFFRRLSISGRQSLSIFSTREVFCALLSYAHYKRACFYYTCKPLMIL